MTLAESLTYAKREQLEENEYYTIDEVVQLFHEGYLDEIALAELVEEGWVEDEVLTEALDNFYGGEVLNEAVTPGVAEVAMILEHRVF